MGGLSPSTFFLVGEVAEVEVHLADVVVLHVAQLQVDEHKAAQDAVVEDQIDLVMAVVDRHPVLPANEGEALAEFQKKGLEVVAEHGFELGFGNLIRLGNFQELEHVGFAQQVGGLLDDLSLRGQLQDAGLVLAGGEAQK